MNVIGGRLLHARVLQSDGENVALGQNLGDFHSGFRVYSRKVLETIPFEANSDNFVFDSEFLAQAAHFGFRIGDAPIPCRYFDEASSIRFTMYSARSRNACGVNVSRMLTPISSVAKSQSPRSAKKSATSGSHMQAPPCPMFITSTLRRRAASWT